MKGGLRLCCVSLKEQSVGCGNVVEKCVQCIQWTRVSHIATAVEMTHVCQTDFMSLHIIEDQGDVQVSKELNLGTCRSMPRKTIRISHQDTGTLEC